jgi:hypothetical protein
MSEKVVGLHGAWTPQPAAANATVVTELERLLEAARAGEIIGFAGSYQHRDKAVVTWSFAGFVAGYGMIGAIECLKDRLLRVMSKRD